MTPAEMLAATDPAHLTWLERLDLVRAWERQLSWAAARRLSAIAALEDPDPGEGPNPLPEFVPDWCREEIATALHVTGTAAQNQLDLARELRARLAATSAALRAAADRAQGRADRAGRPRPRRCGRRGRGSRRSAGRALPHTPRTAAGAGPHRVGGRPGRCTTSMWRCPSPGRTRVTARTSTGGLTRRRVRQYAPVASWTLY